jgi:hypothetical protein
MVWSLLQVKDLAQDAVREQVPGLVAATITSHVPAMIDEVGAAGRQRTGNSTASTRDSV